MARTVRASLLALMVVATFETTAAAQSRLPVPYQQRPLTLPRGTLRPTLASVLSSYPDPDGRDTRLYFYGALGAGVTDDFELGALVLPLRVAPDADYGDGGVGLPPVVTPWFAHNRPEVYGRYRFVEGDVEIGVEAHFVLPAPDPFELVLGIPFLFRAGDLMRFDTGFYLTTDFDDDTHGFIPFVMTIQATSRFFVGLDTGFWVRPEPAVPFGVLFGYTVGRPVVDLKGGVRFVDVTEGGDVWQIWFAADFYAFL